MGHDDEPVCPECKAGKHQNCDTTAWDFNTDTPTWCRCWAEDHQGVKPG